MENQTYQTACPVCSKIMKLVQAGISKKTGENYNAFWSCPDYSCNSTLPYGAKTPQQPTKVVPERANGNAIILDEIQRLDREINGRLDKLIQFLVDKLK